MPSTVPSTAAPTSMPPATASDEANPAIRASPIGSSRRHSERARPAIERAYAGPMGHEHVLLAGGARVDAIAGERGCSPRQAAHVGGEQRAPRRDRDRAHAAQIRRAEICDAADHRRRGLDPGEQVRMHPSRRAGVERQAVDAEIATSGENDVVGDDRHRRNRLRRRKCPRKAAAAAIDRDDGVAFERAGDKMPGRHRDAAHHRAVERATPQHPAAGKVDRANAAVAAADVKHAAGDRRARRPMREREVGGSPCRRRRGRARPARAGDRCGGRAA